MLVERHGARGARTFSPVPITFGSLLRIACEFGIRLIAVRRRRPDMNLLMVVAVGGAVYLNEWLEAATVSFLFTLSVALKSWSIRRARRAVAALLDLTSTTVAVLQEDGSERTAAPTL